MEKVMEAFNTLRKFFILFDCIDVFISKKDGKTGYMWLINSDHLEEIIEEIDNGDISKMLREKLNSKSKGSVDVN